MPRLWTNYTVYLDMCEYLKILNSFGCQLAKDPIDFERQNVIRSVNPWRRIQFILDDFYPRSLVPDADCRRARRG